MKTFRFEFTDEIIKAVTLTVNVTTITYAAATAEQIRHADRKQPDK